MIYKALDTIKLKTLKGEVELMPGQKVTLPYNVALKLVNDGRIAPIEKAIYEVYSNILDDFLWIVADEKELRDLIAEGIKDAVYTHDDISKLTGKDISKDALRKIQSIKKAFPGSTVEDIRDNKPKKV